VLAIEPGLWNNQTGEIRFEDLGLVTEHGSETLTRFDYRLSPQIPNTHICCSST